jgi:hypothetical protein
MIVNDGLGKMWKQSIMAYFKALCQHLSEGTVSVASFRGQIFRSRPTTTQRSIRQCQNTSRKQVYAANLDDNGSIVSVVLLGTGSKWMLHPVHAVKQIDFKNVRSQAHNFAQRQIH